MLTPTAELSRLTDEQYRIVKKQRIIGRAFLIWAVMMTALSLYVVIESENAVYEAEIRAEMAIEGVYSPTIEDIYETIEVRTVVFEICDSRNDDCDEYDEIRKVLDTINKRLEKARNLLDHLNEIKQKEADFVSSWKQDLEDVEDRFSNIIKSLPDS